MYHDTQGREIEDLEMQNMHRDAREAEKSPLITGQMIHEAFNHVVPTSESRPWADLTPVARSTYHQMATHLNTIAGLPQPCPFCAFYEFEPRPVKEGMQIAGHDACGWCAEANQRADIAEMLLQWLEDEVGGTV